MNKATGVYNPEHDARYRLSKRKVEDIRLKPKRNPYHRNPQQIAAAMAITKRQLPDPDLPEHASPPIAPKYVQERNDQTVRLATAASAPRKKPVQLKLI